VSAAHSRVVPARRRQASDPQADVSGVSLPSSHDRQGQLHRDHEDQRRGSHPRRTVGLPGARRRSGDRRHSAVARNGTADPSAFLPERGAAGSNHPGPALGRGRRPRPQPPAQGAASRFGRTASAQRRRGSRLHLRDPARRSRRNGGARVAPDRCAEAFVAMSARMVVALVLLHAVMAPRPGRGQSFFEVRPLMATAQLYDSNLFFTSTDPQADFIMRISPGVLSEYRSPRLALRGRYTLDVERFAEHPELSGIAARQQAAIVLASHATPRVALAADAEYSTTHAPSELNAETGLILSRAKADRVAAHAAITRHLDRATTATMDY